MPYYAQFFNTAEHDATFYEKFYKYMTKETFEKMAETTPEGFEFSEKVPEIITHNKMLDVKKGAIDSLNEFLEKIFPLKRARKLGAILIQLPPSFSVAQFKQTEEFLDRLPSSYEFALEFRHPSWQTEGPYELLQQYNIAAVMTDSPEPKLQYLSDIAVTADHVFIRLHGRNKDFWYNYLYSKEELRPWMEKVSKLKIQAKKIRVYFNNHWAGKAVVNALQFKELTGSLSDNERKAMERAEQYLTGRTNLDEWAE